MDAGSGDDGRRGSFPRAVAGTREGERSRERRADDARATTNGVCVVLRRSQTEWRGLGVQQSRGWVHYAIVRAPRMLCALRRLL